MYAADVVGGLEDGEAVVDAVSGVVGLVDEVAFGGAAVVEDVEDGFVDVGEGVRHLGCGFGVHRFGFGAISFWDGHPTVQTDMA